MAWLGPDGENADGADGARGVLAAFRGELYRCFTRRADALFEVCRRGAVQAGPGAHAGGTVAGA